MNEIVFVEKFPFFNKYRRRVEIQYSTINLYTLFQYEYAHTRTLYMYFTDAQFFIIISITVIVITMLIIISVILNIVMVIIIVITEGYCKGSETLMKPITLRASEALP